MRRDIDHSPMETWAECNIRAKAYLETKHIQAEQEIHQQNVTVTVPRNPVILPSHQPYFTRSS
jgi:hypothetical protein